MSRMALKCPLSSRLCGKDRPASGALDAPNGETTETNPGLMGVTSQRVAVTGRLMVKLQAQREDEGQHELDERRGVLETLKVGGFIVAIDGDGAVLAGGFGGL